MSNFSQMMGNRSEAQRIYEQRKKIKWLEKKLKEKEKLNDKYVNAVADYEEQKFIISELENYLNKVIETSTEQERITCSFVLQYLQELKGENKE